MRHFRDMFQPRAKELLMRFHGISWSLLAALILGCILAAALRYSLLPFKTLDYYASLKRWYDTIKSLGFAAFATPFSTYNPPYLYLLYLIVRFLPGQSPVVAVKIPSLLADFIMAYIVYRIVRLHFPDSGEPLLAALLVLFAPTIVLNSAFWGQADSLYTVGLAACLLFLLAERPGWAMLAFSIALAFKLQAIFLAPLLAALFLRRVIPWKYLLTVPAVLILALVPCWLAGRPLLDLLNIYLYEASQFELLTLNAPSIYSWLPASKEVFNLLYFPGVILGAISAYLYFLIVYKAPHKLSRSSLVELALLATLVIPFFLPKMHERYFYPADVLSIVFAFYFPEFYFVPVLVSGVSFFAYQPYLFHVQMIPMPILTGILLVTICLLTYHSIRGLYSSPASPALDLPEAVSLPQAGAPSTEEA